MVLEEEVHARPSGVCNVNKLCEVTISHAQRIDVLRGPGTVNYGSNALHGVISVATPGPAAQSYSQVAV